MIFEFTLHLKTNTCRAPDVPRAGRSSNRDMIPLCAKWEAVCHPALTACHDADLGHRCSGV